MRHCTKRRVGIFLAAALVAHTAGCGTLFYPERKGQKGGDVDPTVAILDGLGLLCFLLPGIVAFIVDFDNGTIYLPGTGMETPRAPRDGELANPKLWTAVQVGPGRLDAETIRSVVMRGTGVQVDLGDARLEVGAI